MSNTSILWYFGVRNSFLTIFLKNNHGLSVKSKMAAINLYTGRDKLWYFVYGLIIYGHNQSQNLYGIEFWEEKMYFEQYLLKATTILWDQVSLQYTTPLYVESWCERHVCRYTVRPALKGPPSSRWFCVINIRYLIRLRNVALWVCRNFLKYIRRMLTYSD